MNPTSLEQQVQKLVDKENIREVLYRYCQAVDRCDTDLLKSCYHENSHDDHGFFSGTGWKFAEYVIPKLRELELSIHALTNIEMTLENDQAVVKSQWSVVHRMKRFGKFTDICDQGRYLDRFQKIDGEWKISSRIVVMDAERWINTVNFMSLVPPKTPHQVYRGSRSPSDPVYSIQHLLSEPRSSHELKNLWFPYHVLLNIPRCLLHWVGKWVQRPRARGLQNDKV